VDSAILDPLNRELRAALLAAELVLGRDDYGLNYTRAYRADLFNGSGAKANCA
jgi:5-methyltetrahydrofolate--homocysteine methyltransferase